MWWLGKLTIQSTYAHDVAAPLFALGFGLGLTFAPAISVASAAVDERNAGVASAMVKTSQQGGGAVGTAVLSTVFSSTIMNYIATHTPDPRLRAAAAARLHRRLPRQLRPLDGGIGSDQARREVPRSRLRRLDLTAGYSAA